MEWFKSIN